MQSITKTIWREDQEAVAYDFTSMKREDLNDFIYEMKKEIGSDVTILAHNFTADDIIPFADVIGDSSTLTNATRTSQSEFLLFTAARFFTEVACILVPQKKILQANLQANCPLTYMVDEEATRLAYESIKNKCQARDLMPMGYFTASYQLKSFCGEFDGTVCTASNSEQLISHYLNLGKSIFFTPMNNIAFNTIKTLNIGADEVYLIDENTDLDRIPGDRKIYVWDVGCYVHSAFSVDDINSVRERYRNNNIKIIAHLECLPEVIEECDHACFTDGMHSLIQNGEPGSCWGVATTNNFAVRMANTYPDKQIVAVRPDLLCKDMVVTDLPHLAESLQSIIDYKDGKSNLKYEISVPEIYRKNAKKAIDTMFEINHQKNIKQEFVPF